ncbi:type I restriction enzyme, S subunit [Bacillus altitudinis]|uniref:restriction endonuclease subunit S n=1 Tax=Bacillus altitudinis TaxID=293387 RepID=UPI00040FBFA0|nr:restriction endonuclease subunit S [Bacillus altitudinis]MDR4199632.1 restriction endonuclease subunit S [Bacillus altitudinis]
MGSKRVPEVRFKGFSGEWDECKIVDVLNINSGRDYKHLKKGDIPVYGTGGYMHSVNDKLSDDDAIGIGRKGTINKPQLLLAPFWTVDTLFYMTVKGKNDLYFLYSLANKIDWKKYDESTGVPSLSKNSIYKISINVPLLREQTRIGNFFKQLDETIAIQQQELDTLKQTKQGFLQKIFPKEGKSMPEIRFPEFYEKWEKYQLGDLSKIRRGASPRPIQDPKWFDDESDVGWLRISDVTEQNGLIHFVEQHISKEGQRKTLVLNEPHLILSIAATVGKPVINYIKTGIHDGFIVFMEPNFNIEFMFHWLEMFRPQWQKYGQPGSQVNLNSELVREQQISLPSIDEQTKIGNFFKQLDETIALYEQELNVLKQTQKAFLQKMFV